MNGIAKINPGKGYSTTTPERYIHVKEGKYRGTVFFRQDVATGLWYAAGANLHHKDNFDRPKGRKAARGKFFDPKNPQRISVEFPSRIFAEAVLQATTRKS